jgi:ADP-heptose:LPS heptosyltransferase
MKKEDNKIKKIVFLRMEHIGDYGQGLVALKALKEHFPNARIDLVVGPWNKDFAEATPYKNNIIIFENTLIKRHLKYWEILKIIFCETRKYIKFFKKINHENYDLLFSISDRNYNRIFLKFLKAKKKISGLSYPNPGINENLRIQKFLEKNQLGIKSYNINLNYSKKDKEIVENILKKIKGKKIIINPITDLPEKNWPLDKWIVLIKWILSKSKRNNVLIMGAEYQKEQIENLIKSCNAKGRIYNMAGKLSVTQSIYIIDKCDLIIGNDSGPVHWAELVNTPAIALFGPTDAIRWGIQEKNGITIKKEKINYIPIEEVQKAVEKYL